MLSFTLFISEEERIDAAVANFLLEGGSYISDNGSYRSGSYSGDDDYSDQIKGWMSPSGKVHNVKSGHEHFDNHHPEYLRIAAQKKLPTNGRLSLQAAQKHGFVRFGKLRGSIHGPQPFVHYDSRHPQGAETAMKALRYMEPEHDEQVSLSGRAGLWKGKKSQDNDAWSDAGNYNSGAREQLEKTLPAREAYRHLYQQMEKSKAKQEKLAAAPKVASSKVSTSIPHPFRPIRTGVVHAVHAAA